VPNLLLTATRGKIQASGKSAAHLRQRQSNDKRDKQLKKEALKYMGVDSRHQQAKPTQGARSPEASKAKMQ